MKVQTSVLVQTAFVASLEIAAIVILGLAHVFQGETIAGLLGASIALRGRDASGGSARHPMPSGGIVGALVAFSGLRFFRHPAVLALAMVGFLPSCTARDRAIAGAVISGAAPAVCELAAVVATRADAPGDVPQLVGTFCQQGAAAASHMLETWPAESSAPQLRAVIKSAAPVAASPVVPLRCEDGTAPAPFPGSSEGEGVCPAFRARYLNTLGIGRAH